MKWKKVQPFKMLHGGVSALISESIASLIRSPHGFGLSENSWCSS